MKKAFILEVPTGIGTIYKYENIEGGCFLMEKFVNAKILENKQSSQFRNQFSFDPSRFVHFVLRGDVTGRETSFLSCTLWSFCVA